MLSDMRKIGDSDMQTTEAMDQVLANMRPWVHRKALTLLPDAEAEDAAQEAMVAIWKAMDRFDPGMSRNGEPWGFATFVGRQALNRHAAKFYAKEEMYAAPGEHDHTDGVDHTFEDAAQVADSAALSSRLQEALAMLPTRQRDAVIGMDVLGMTAGEVALEVGVKEPSGIRRARRDGHKALRSILGEDLGGWFE